MELRPLGRTGIEVPVVGLGTARVFNVRGDADQARCEAVIDAAVEQGATLIDTSPMYGESEEVVARAVSERRDEVLVADKVWARTRAVGEEQIERALDWFGTIDLYQVHNLLAVDEYLPILAALRKAGRVRAVGITHYLPSMYGDMLALMRQGGIDAIQIPYYAGETHAADELLPACAELGIGVLAMTPLGAGRLLEHPPPQEQLAPLAAAGIHTWPQALLKWVLSDPRITCVIPATSRVEHMRENAAVGRPPWLDAAQRRLIQDLASQAATGSF